MQKVDLSIIIPVYNEEKNVPALYTELKPVLESLGRTYEVLFIDDGSQDASWGELKKLAQADPSVKIIQQGRNQGLTQAYQNGFDNSCGEYVITLASDLENEALEIVKVVQKLDEGFDVVNTNRVGRWKEKKSSSVFRSIPSHFANKIITWVTGVKLKDAGSGLKGFRRFVVENLKMYGEMHRFVAAYCGIYTKRIVEIDVKYKDRIYGRSSYSSLSRTFKVILDLFAIKFLVSLSTKPYSLMPGRLFGSVGLVMWAFGGALSAYLITIKLFFGQSIGDRPLLIFSFLFIVLGTQFVMTGLIGELLMRVYFESGNRKVYTIREKINFN